MALRVRDVAIELYQFGSAVAEPAGIILADTKFEFGIDRETGELLLIDEVLTPDSSRFWDASDYEPGRAQASFDKQFVRDWLETQAWDKTPPGPELPADIVAGTRARYVEAFERITGDQLRRLPRRRHGEVLSVDVRFAVNVAPKDGILDPQGRAVEGSLGHLGIEGVSAVRVGRRVELTVTADDVAAARAVVERLAERAPLESADRALRGRGAGRRVVARGWRRVTTRIGVVIFPGSNRDIDAFNGLRVAGRRAGRAVARAGLARRRRRGPDPGRLRVRRLPPGGRHRPVQPGHALRCRVRRRRRPRPRHLQRLPGPDGGASAARRAAAEPRPPVRGPPGRDHAGAARHAVHPPRRRAAAAADAGRPRRGLLLRRRGRSRRAGARRPGPLPLRPPRRDRGRRDRRSRPIPTARCGRSPA